MIAAVYRAQVDLLLRVLPSVAEEPSLALKGGTAINLFVRDLPRLSVDIDLTYLPFEPRDEALANIATALGRIAERLQTAIPGIRVSVLQQRDGQEAKLLCDYERAQVKIEVNTTMRGHIQPVRLKQVSDRVQDEFGKFAAIQVVSHGELFGGKICAALDRQHPRDLFDVHHLMRHEGLHDDIRPGFLAALLSHPRPIREMLDPNLSDQRTLFETAFAGMSLEPFDYEDYETTRLRLIQDVKTLLSETDRLFLYGFKAGEPDWALSPVPDLERLPAVRWKLANIARLKRENPASHAEQLAALRSVLSM